MIRVLNDNANTFKKNAHFDLHPFCPIFASINFNFQHKAQSHYLLNILSRRVLISALKPPFINIENPQRNWRNNPLKNKNLRKMIFVNNSKHTQYFSMSFRYFLKRILALKFPLYATKYHAYLCAQRRKYKAKDDYRSKHGTKWD